MRWLAVTIGMLLLCACGQAPATSPEQAAWSRAQAYTELVWGNDFAGAAAYAAPGSPAARYLEHLKAVGEATAASAPAGTHAPATPAATGSVAPVTLTVDDAAGTIAIASGEVAHTWHGFTHDDAGLVTGWLIDDSATPLGERLWSAPATATATAGSLDLVSAFANDDGLWVVVRLTAGAAALTPDAAPVLTVDGRRLRPDHTAAPEQVAAHGEALVALGFADAELGGTLGYRLLGAGGKALAELELPIS
jgi:hypothetical protein